MTWNGFCRRLSRFLESAAKECERRGVKPPKFAWADLGDYYHVRGVNATGRGFARFMIERIEQRKKDKKQQRAKTRKHVKKQN